MVVRLWEKEVVPIEEDGMNIKIHFTEKGGLESEKKNF